MLLSFITNIAKENQPALTLTVFTHYEINLLGAEDPGVGRRETESNEVSGECNWVSVLVITSVLYLSYIFL